MFCCFPSDLLPVWIFWRSTQIPSRRIPIHKISMKSLIALLTTPYRQKPWQISKSGQSYEPTPTPKQIYKRSLSVTLGRLNLSSVPQSKIGKTIIELVVPSQAIKKGTNHYLIQSRTDLDHQGASTALGLVDLAHSTPTLITRTPGGLLLDLPSLMRPTSLWMGSTFLCCQTAVVWGWQRRVPTPLTLPLFLGLHLSYSVAIRTRIYGLPATTIITITILLTPTLYIPPLTHNSRIPTSTHKNPPRYRRRSLPLPPRHPSWTHPGSSCISCSNQYAHDVWRYWHVGSLERTPGGLQEDSNESAHDHSSLESRTHRPTKAPTTALSSVQRGLSP